MSSRPPTRSWGPSHQYRPPPRSNRWKWKLGAFGLLFVAGELFTHRLLSQGAIPSGMAPAQFVAYIAAETKKWAQVVKVSGAKVD